MAVDCWRVRIRQRFGMEELYTCAEHAEGAISKVIQKRYGRRAYASAPLRDSLPGQLSVVILEPRRSNTATAMIAGPVKIHAAIAGTKRHKLCRECVSQRLTEGDI